MFPRCEIERKSESVPRGRAIKVENIDKVPAKLPKLATQLINSSVDFFPDNNSPTGRMSSLRSSPRGYQHYRTKHRSPGYGYGPTPSRN